MSGKKIVKPLQMITSGGKKNLVDSSGFNENTSSIFSRSSVTHFYVLAVEIYLEVRLSPLPSKLFKQFIKQFIETPAETFFIKNQ